jgi:hypothetical protein
VQKEEQKRRKKTTPQKMSIRFSDCTFPTEETRSSCILTEESEEFGKDADTSGNKFLSISNNEVINEPNKITNKKG